MTIDSGRSENRHIVEEPEEEEETDPGKTYGSYYSSYDADDGDWDEGDWDDYEGTSTKSGDPNEVVKTITRTEKGFSVGTTIEVKEETYGDGKVKVTRTTTYSDGKVTSYDYIKSSGSLSNLFGWGYRDSSYKDYYGSKKEGYSYSSSWSSRYGSWWGSSIGKNEEYNKIIASVRRSANIVSNAKEGEKEKAIDVRWSDGTQTNSVKGDDIYLSPEVVSDKKTRKSEWDKDERTDVLIGEVLSQSAMKRTMMQVVERRMINRGREGTPEGTLAKSLWYTTELLAAEQDVTDTYPGFRGYFASHRDYYTDANAFDVVQSLLHANESAFNAMLALRWQLLHPDKNLELPKHTAMALDLAFKEIAKTKTSKDREQVANKLAKNFLKVWPVNPPPTPPTPSDDPWDQLRMAVGGKSGKGEKSPSNIGESESREESEEKEKEQGSPIKVMMGESEERGEETVSNEEEIKEDESNRMSVEFEGDHWKGGTKEVYLKADSRTELKYRNLVQKLRSPIAALQNRLKIRNEDARIVEHGLKKGDLDEGSLYKLGFHHYNYDDPNLFEETSIIDRPDVGICILVDESGSMAAKYSVARNSCIVLVNALKSIRGVNICVFGHTGQGTCHGSDPETLDEEEGMAIHHYYTPKNKSEAALSRIYAFTQNLDGYALDRCGQLFLEWYGGCPTKLMIVVSDGYPEAHGYGGSGARRHVQKVREKLARFGVDTVAIGIGRLSSEHYEFMYGKGKVAIVGDEINTGVMSTAGNIITRAIKSAGRTL